MIRLCSILFITAMILSPSSPEPQVRTARLEPRNPSPPGSLNIDSFFGSREDAKPRKVYGGLEVRDLLTACTGDPLRPSKKGAVLTGLNFVSHGVLAPHSATKSTSLSGVQHILFIASGWGTIKSDSVTADIRQGFGIIIPPGVKFTLANGGVKPLTLYLIEEPVKKGFIPRKTLVIKNDFDTPISTNVRRAGSDGWLFGRPDGLAALDGMDVIAFVPRSYVAPHVHLPGDEEIWIALDDMNVQLGKENRVLGEGSAYKVPADGRTPHVNINDTRATLRLLWLMRTPDVPVERKPSPQRGRNSRDII